MEKEMTFQEIIIDDIVETIKKQIIPDIPLLEYNQIGKFRSVYYLNDDNKNIYKTAQTNLIPELSNKLNIAISSLLQYSVTVTIQEIIADDNVLNIYFDCKK